MGFSEIRKISIDSITSNNEGFGVLSNLNWKRYEKQLNEIIKFMPQHPKILDIGCGRGMTTVMLKKTIPNAKVTGIDIRKFSSWGKYKKYGVTFSLGDATNLKFKKQEFDAVVSFGVIEHVDSGQKFIKENLRVLKKNGVGFLLNIPNKYSMNEFFARKFGLWTHEIKYNYSELRTLLKSNGIENFIIKRRFLIPAQFNRLNSTMGKFFDRIYLYADFLDRLLYRTPAGFFSQVFDVFYKKDL